MRLISTTASTSAAGVHSVVAHLGDGDGDGTIVFETQATAAADAIALGVGDDVVITSPGNDRAIGGPGRDRLEGWDKVLPGLLADLFAGQKLDKIRCGGKDRIH